MHTCVLGNGYGFTYPVEDGQHHVELLLLLLLRHVSGRMAEFGEEAAQVHQAQGVVLGAALLLTRPPHDPLHHVHLQRLAQDEARPERKRKTPVGPCKKKKCSLRASPQQRRISKSLCDLVLPEIF